MGCFFMTLCSIKEQFCVRVVHVQICLCEVVAKRPCLCAVFVCDTVCAPSLFAKLFMSNIVHVRRSLRPMLMSTTGYE